MGGWEGLLVRRNFIVVGWGFISFYVFEIRKVGV